MVDKRLVSAVPFVVFARCRDHSGTVEALRAHNASFVVYQKTGKKCDSIPSLRPHEIVRLPHNRGDECSAYLHYLASEYDRLPASIAFVQMSCSRQLFVANLYDALAAVAKPVRRLGFVALSRHSFEGRWPAPCESRYKLDRFKNCSARWWRQLRPDAPEPAALRFYANGLFAVSRERVRARPRAFYEQLAARLAGDAPPMCDAPDTRSMHGKTRLGGVGDCHLLEKTWHVLFGQTAELPEPKEYNALRSPTVACPFSARTVEDGRIGRRPEERCSQKYLDCRRPTGTR